MGMLSKFLAGSAAAAALVAVAAGPALADPPSGTVPRVGDLTGVGANTDQFLYNQVANVYNKSHANAKVYSWDATNPTTGVIGDSIVTKSGCAAIPRPDGTGAGISALEANTTDPSNPSDFCIDYARAASPRSSSQPACASGGICFVNLAGDAVSWAVRSTAAGGTDAPANLTVTQLKNIFECKTKNWSQVGGKSGVIKAFLPITSAGTRTFWLLALGGGTTPITPGACVSDENNTLEENEGIDPVLNSPQAIFIFSVGDYVGQKYHSATCTKSDCTGNPPCTPTSKQNQFGCNQTGVLTLGSIGGSKPLTSGTVPKINPNFDHAFQRLLYDVVRFSSSTSDHIPANLEPLFSAATAAKPGYFCGTAVKKYIQDYGFLVIPTCGSVS